MELHRAKSAGVEFTEDDLRRLVNRSLFRMPKETEVGKESVLHFLPPAHLCPICCLNGIGRQQVLIARNPYLRIMSYFKYRFLNSVLFSSKTTWDDFGPWLGAVLGFRA